LLQAIANFNAANATVVPPDASQTKDNIGAAYNDILGRDADQGGEDYFTKAIAAGGNISQVRDDLANSPEAKIQQMYNDLLGRSADQGGLDYFVNAANSGGTMADIRRDIAASQEAQKYQSFAGGGYTGDASRSGGLDGQGGFMAMLHPQEDVVDRTRPSNDNSNEGSSNVYALTTEIRELRMEQREMLMAISKNTKRSLDIERKHDTQGMPPVRSA
jgi:hypothetical protein